MKEFFPAEYFDKQYKTKLSKKWKLPNKHNEDSLVKLFIKEGYIDIFIQLMILNPELNDIKILDDCDLWDVCYGVASRFNYNDIKYYVETWNKIWDSKSGDKYRSKFMIVERKNNIDFQWVPSPETLEIFKTIKGK